MFACSIPTVYRIKITEVSKDTVIISLTSKFHGYPKLNMLSSFLQQYLHLSIFIASFYFAKSL